MADQRRGDRLEAAHTEDSEADALEQATPADPADDGIDGLPDGGPDRPISEADWIDQQREVLLDDEIDGGAAGTGAASGDEASD